MIRLNVDPHYLRAWLDPRPRGRQLLFRRRRWDGIPTKAPKKKGLGDDPLAGNVRVKQAAGILGVSPKTIYKIMKQGHLHYTRVGRAITIPKAALRDFVLRNTTGGWALKDDPEGGERR